jgi:APA family basic amino acid/polyamine antiporter
VTVCIGVLVLRKTRPDLPRPFRAPLPWVTCILGAAICFLMMVALGVPTWVRLVLWTVVGVVVYIAYGRKHSRVGAALNGTAGGKTTPATSA